ncbi:ANGPT2 [Branchiostoma lanceolatum]|uniref:ANGPT2 protein n=1 Tax=Branchiostoma lanceolatum TaxID=7740 RepID=A0A8K0AFB9_BRALA|nr:ANGPT2 [Branchiostoma lanceolatum]
MDQAYLDAQEDGNSPQGQCAEDVTLIRRCVLNLRPILGYVVAFCAGIAVAAIMAVIINGVIPNHQGPQGYLGPKILMPTTDLDIAPTNSTIVTMGTTAVESLLVTMATSTTRPVKTTLMTLPPISTTDDERGTELLLTDSTSCASLRPLPGPGTGVYTINIAGWNVPVLCDMDTAGGGWTVIQRRFDGSVDFDRRWKDYSDGFGHPSGEYWLGLKHVHQLTSRGRWTLRIDLERRDSDRTSLTPDPTLEPHAETVFWAEYGFRVSSESTNYRICLAGFTGTAGDSMNTVAYPWNAAGGMMFSTPDRDNDGSRSRHCAGRLKSGWWYNDCTLSGLNNKYPDNDGPCNSKDYMEWHFLSDRFHCLSKVSMKIRPADV